ncbi:hypothetical protein GQ600_213 [Phytophthora cactorum]|nr:hypothetical protein GQ600_213 [Phytophthora cactorum]
MNEVDAGRQDVELPRLEYHTEDKDDDLLMDDYDVGLLGREYVLTFPATGLRMTRSPSGSADNEHKAKRAQHQPTRQDGPITPSALLMPSLPSLPQDQASADNAMSAHMLLGAGGLAYIAQGFGSFAAEGDFGLMDDIKMVEPRKDAPSVTSRSVETTARHLVTLEAANMMHETDAEAREAVANAFGTSETKKRAAKSRELEKASKPQDYVKLEAVRQDAPAPDAAEAVSLEHARLESLFTEKRQSREAEADAMRAQWPQNTIEAWWHETATAKLPRSCRSFKPTTAREAGERVDIQDGARNASSRRMERVRNKTKGTSSCGRTPKRSKRRDDSPPGPDSSLSSSYSVDSDSDSSSSSSDDDLSANMVATILKEVSTMLTFRPYVNSSILSEFGTKASLWEKFVNIASQELKLKLPEAARDWFNQLPKSIQRDWKELASAFRKKVGKARTSYSERYYTWK